MKFQIWALVLSVAMIPILVVSAWWRWFRNERQELSRSRSVMGIAGTVTVIILLLWAGSEMVA
jgi:hypothetical protein